MLIFHKEPALWLALVASVVSVGSNFILHWSPEQQALVNAVAFALVGVLTAWSVDRGGLGAAILGFVGAVISLGVGFGWHLNATDQALLATLAAAVVAMFVRTQVVTQVPPSPIVTVA
jgi:hypothetical protein